MSQLIPWLILCVAFLAFSLALPRAARIFAGVFFIVMAVGVNWALSIAAPQVFIALGTAEPLLPFYDWAFRTFVAAAPALFGLLAGVGEITIGVLMLSRDRWARLGLLGGAAFLLLITPLGLWTLPNPIMAAGLVYLSTKRLDSSLSDNVRQWFDRRAAAHSGT